MPTDDSAATTDRAGITGTLIIERRDKDGKLIERFEGHNLITQVGDQMYGERGASVSGALAAPTGFKLGTGATAPAKTGAGAALGSYLAGSNKAFDATFPTTALQGSSRRIQYKRTYAAGEATTASPITEAVIVNDAIGTDATSTAANTVSRTLVTGISQKQATDSLTCIWNHDLLGA
jgi:hypothetical protein